MELGDIDAESDQVLLGSAFDDTRNVQAALSIMNNDTARRTLGQTELAVVEEDEAAKTVRVHEAWRRQKLVDHMRMDEEEDMHEEQDEDDEAEDYPVHGRFADKPKHNAAEEGTTPAFA